MVLDTTFCVGVNTKLPTRNPGLMYVGDHCKGVLSLLILGTAQLFYSQGEKQLIRNVWPFKDITAIIRIEDASGEGEQKCWFGEGGCLESSEMESGSLRDCC